MGIYTYTDPLVKDAISAPSLMQIYLAKTVGNEFRDTVGADGVYEVHVLSQAVQYAGFETAGAETALNDAFGAATAAQAAEWFAAAKEASV